MGQNNDVAWTFTNVMADVEDLFIERIEGDRYEFEGEWLTWSWSRRRSRSRAATAPVRHRGPLTHHGPIVNDALGADDSQPLALRWIGARRPRHRPRPPRDLRADQRRAELVELLGDLTMPVSNLIWADRRRQHRLQDRRPHPDAARRLPRPAEAGLDRRVRVGRRRPLRGAARADRPRARLPRHRQQPDRRRRLPPPPHQRLPRRLPREADRAADRRDRRARPRQLPPHADRPLLDPRRRGRAPARARLDAAAASARSRAIERLKSWDRELGPDTIAGTIYQAFLLRLAREFARAAIGDRDLAERWLDRSDSGFTDPRHLALALALPPAGALGGGRRGADRPPLGRARARRAARRARRPASALRPRSRGLALGPRPRAALPARARRAPTRPSTGSSTARCTPAAARRPSPRSPTTPTTPTTRSGRRAGAWSPTRADPSARCGRRSPASRATPGARTTTTCSRAGWRAQMQPMAGEGPWETLTLEPGS